MIICHSRKFIFIHIHKTGGTSIERALDPHLAWNDLILGGSPFGEKIQQAYVKKYGLGKHSTVADIERICGSRLIDDYYVFSLVRDPLARLCSMYNFVATTLERWAGQQKIGLDEIRNHITPEAAQKKPALKWASTKAFLQSADFSEFIRRPDLASAPGFRSQASFLAGADGRTPRAQCYRLEDCPAWIDDVIKHTGIEFEFSKANESELKLQDAAAVSSADRDYVVELFREDYEMFGYGF